MDVLHPARPFSKCSFYSMKSENSPLKLEKIKSCFFTLGSVSDGSASTWANTFMGLRGTSSSSELPSSPSLFLSEGGLWPNLIPCAICFCSEFERRRSMNSLMSEPTNSYEWMSLNLKRNQRVQTRGSPADSWLCPRRSPATCCDHGRDRYPRGWRCCRVRGLEIQLDSTPCREAKVGSTSQVIKEVAWSLISTCNKSAEEHLLSSFILHNVGGMRLCVLLAAIKREQRPFSLYVTQRQLPQILLELVIVRHDSIAHQPSGKTGFKLSFGLPLLLLLLLPKESPEGLEFALLSPVCWEINKAEKTNKTDKWCRQMHMTGRSISTSAALDQNGCGGGDAHLCPHMWQDNEMQSIESENMIHREGMGMGGKPQLICLHWLAFTGSQRDKQRV